MSRHPTPLASVHKATAPDSDPDLREHRPLTAFVRNSIIAFAIGLAVIYVLGLANPDVYSFLSFLAGGTVGVCINLCAWGFEVLLVRGPVRTHPGAAEGVRMFAYFLGGAAGWLLGNGIFAVLFDAPLFFGQGALWSSILFFGLMGLVVGLLFYTVDRLRERLRTSVARLKEQEFAEKELELARAIQRRLMPPGEMEGDGYCLAARNLPARVVAGDFYDVYPAGGALGLAVGDVAGKGMGAALIMASAKAMIPLVAGERRVDETLRELNSRLLGDLAPREFVALLLLHFDPASGRFQLANAGLPDPYFLDPHLPPRPLSVPGPRLPLGLRSGVAYDCIEGTLEPGQRLLLFTDGLPEAVVGSSGEPLGYARFETLLAGCGDRPPAEALQGLVEDLGRLTIGQDDDWTLLLLEARRLG